MIIDAENLGAFEAYPWLVGGVTPRPIAWISTISEEGVDNIAPYSFFTVASCTPPVLSFTEVMGATGLHKDTVSNLKATGECVVHVVTEPLLQQMNLSCASLEASVSEFEFAKIPTINSQSVKPKSVEASPVRYECTLRKMLSVGEGAGSGTVVLLDVKTIIVDDALIEEGRMNPHALKTLGKLGGDLYSSTKDTTELKRP